MRRREFIAGIGGVAAAWPIAAKAQKPKIPVVGFLESGSATYASYAAAFHAGLKETGFVEGQNVNVEYRWAEAQYDRLPALFADLVDRQVTVIVASGAVVSPLAARAATTTIPIVFNIGADPVRLGLVPSLNLPAGNITGVTNFGGSDTGAKAFGILRELMPNARAFGALQNPKNPAHSLHKDRWSKISTMVGTPIEPVGASSESDFEPAIASLVEKQVDALYVGPDTLFTSKRDHLLAVLSRYAMPAIFNGKDDVLAGGLMSYGGDREGAYRQLGIYVGRILKGEKPTDLPVVQPTKLEFVINLKTAKSFEITIPDSLVAQATEVIE
jgi:putative ABC transport system substrate-binding protein